MIHPYALMDALALGLAAAPVCLAWCAPALLPLVASRAQATWAAGVKAVAAFLAGRLLSYSVMGLIAGRLGQFVLASEARLALNAALIAAALYLVYYGLAVSNPPREDAPRKPCLALRLTTSSRGPFLVGALTGISFCPPLYLAAAAAARMGSALSGLLYFLAFFAGTSLLALPLAALPRLAARLDRVRLRRAGAGLALAAGFCMALQASRDLARPPAPPAEPVLAAPHGAAPAPQPSPWPAPTDDQLQQAFPGADRFEFAAQPSPHHKALSAPPQSALLGYVFICQDFIKPDQRDQTRGYGGVVPVLAGVDLQGRIAGVALLANQETPRFVQKAAHPSFLDRFRGRHAAAAHPESGEDAVTGATLTSRAVASAVRLGARGFHDAMLAAAPAPAAPHDTSAPWVSTPDLVYLAVLAAGIALMSLAPSKRAELILGLAVVAGLGFWLQRFFSVDDALRLALRAPSAWTWTVTSVLLITLLFGRVFCRLFCPFGMLQDLLWLPLRLRVRLPLALDRGLRWAPAALLWVAASAYAFTDRLPAESVEPFAATFGLTSLDAVAVLGRQNGLMLALIVLCLVSGVVFRRFWCLYLCPAGAALKALSRLRLLRPVVNARCARCPRPSGEEIICPGCAAARASRWEERHDARNDGQ